MKSKHQMQIFIILLHLSHLQLFSMSPQWHV